MPPYFNTGACLFPDYITGLEIENDTISLVSWQIITDPNGYLHVARRTMAGPLALADFDWHPQPGRHRRPGKSLDQSQQIAQASTHPSLG